MKIQPRIQLRIWSGFSSRTLRDPESGVTVTFCILPTALDSALGFGTSLDYPQFSVARLSRPPKSVTPRIALYHLCGSSRISLEC